MLYPHIGGKFGPSIIFIRSGCALINSPAFPLTAPSPCPCRHTTYFTDGNAFPMAPTPSCTKPDATTAPAPEGPVASRSAEPSPVRVTEEPVTGPTDERTTAPEAEQYAMPETETNAPMPVIARGPVGEASAALKTRTLAPATFVPSLAAPMRDGEYNLPVAAFAKVRASSARCYG